MKNKNLCSTDWKTSETPSYFDSFKWK